MKLAATATHGAVVAAPTVLALSKSLSLAAALVYLAGSTCHDGFLSINIMLDGWR